GVSMGGDSCSPKLSAQPFTQTPRRARRFHVCTPLAQTIWSASIRQSSGNASAFAIQSAGGSEPGAVATGSFDAIDSTDPVATAPGSDTIFSRSNQSTSVDSSGHISSFETLGGRDFEGVKTRLSRTCPLSVTPRRKVISPYGRRSTLAPIF